MATPTSARPSPSPSPSPLATTGSPIKIEAVEQTDADMFDDDDDDGSSVASLDDAVPSTSISAQQKGKLPESESPSNTPSAPVQKRRRVTRACDEVSCQSIVPVAGFR